ncbi:helix-turn-helix domain-containing protein [Nocardia sp. NBC_01499]|uniref:GlxA family transcriptional regulator n=1 Tax=Nocardia sp. NBC_01499 TaxID=2903597 RepID=UPI0038683976
MKMVAIVVPAGVNTFDMAMGGQLFAGVRLPDGSPGYDVRFCGDPTVALASGNECGMLQTTWPLATIEQADTVIVPAAASIFQPATPDVIEPLDPRLVVAVQRAADRGARVASICTGAFALAAMGLLDGMRATTHWLYCDELARRSPLVQVDPTVLFVDNDSVVTSAGATAGLDMCMHLVRRDYGSAVATDTSRLLVMPLQRDGGQAQFIPQYLTPRDATALQPVLDWIDHNLVNPLTLADIAKHAGLSVRTLQRRFRTQLGTTTLNWLLAARIHRAQYLLETTDLSVDRIAAECGFGSVVNLRHHFTRQVGTPPRNYRRTFSHRTAS